MPLIKYPAAKKKRLGLKLSPNLEKIYVKAVAENKKIAQEKLTESIPAYSFSTYKAYRGPNKLVAKTKIPLYKNKSLSTLLTICYKV